jgi:hypothetical protein
MTNSRLLEAFRGHVLSAQFVFICWALVITPQIHKMRQRSDEPCSAGVETICNAVFSVDILGGQRCSQSASLFDHWKVVKNTVIMQQELSHHLRSLTSRFHMDKAKYLFSYDLSVRLAL